jgi:hypothetical protein
LSIPELLVLGMEIVLTKSRRDAMRI